MGSRSGKNTTVLSSPTGKLPPSVVTVRCGHAWSTTVSRGTRNPVVHVKISLICEILVFISNLFQTNTV